MLLDATKSGQDLPVSRTSRAAVKDAAALLEQAESGDSGNEDRYGDRLCASYCKCKPLTAITPPLAFCLFGYFVNKLVIEVPASSSPEGAFPCLFPLCSFSANKLPSLRCASGKAAPHVDFCSHLPTPFSLSRRFDISWSLLEKEILMENAPPSEIQYITCHMLSPTSSGIDSHLSLSYSSKEKKRAW